MIIQKRGEGKSNKEIIVFIGGELCINKIENILDDILKKVDIPSGIINMYQKYINPMYNVSIIYNISCSFGKYGSLSNGEI